MARISINSLSSLVNGMNSGYRMVRDINREDEDRQFVSMQRARQQKQWADDDALKADLKMAGTPAEVQPDMQKAETQDNRDVGLPGEEAPTQRGFKVGQQQFASMKDATKAADAHNAPDAVSARMSTALLKGGKPVEAQQLRTGARQEKVAELQLSDMERVHVDKLYDQQLAGVTSFDALGQFLTNSKGDGQGGALKVAAVPSADGKSITVHQVQADGTSVATPYSFSNDARGLTQAKLMLAKSVSVADKVTHLRQQAMEAIAQQNADTQAGYRADQAENMREQRRLEEQKLGILAAKGAPGKGVLEGFDEKLARETAHDAVKAENKRRADAGQPLLSGQEAAALADSYVGAQRATHNNNLVLAAAANDLTGLDPSSPEYQQAYGRALTFGNKDQMAAALKARGFEPPRGAMTKAEMIRRDMEATGVKDAIVEINGTRMAHGNARLGPAAAPAQATAGAAPMARMADVAGADSAQGAKLDQARAARVQAQQVLAGFGLRQRAADPQGFAAAQASFAQAQQAEAAAQQEWQASVQGGDRAFRRTQQVVAR